MTLFKILTLGVIAFFCTAWSPQIFAEPSQPVRDGIARIEAASAGQALVSMDNATEVTSFLRLGPGSLSTVAVAGATANDKTREFLDEYGDIFGLIDHQDELLLSRTFTDSHGRERSRYRQVYRGIPVFGAELSSHFDQQGRLVAISASTFEIGIIETNPVWNSSESGLTARSHVARQGSARADATKLSVADSELVIFRSGLARGIPGKNHLAYRFEVVDAIGSIREFVFVSAHTGKVLDQITGIQEELDRKVSEEIPEELVWQDSENDPESLPDGWAEGTDQQIIDWQNEIDASRETYNLFASMTAGTWRSYDGDDVTMHTINNSLRLPAPCAGSPNASWDGQFTNYCPGVTGDDTVAHEWGHAYTENTANLIYQWQSGALNESYSDVWGEVVDLLNERGTDLPDTLRTETGCSIYGNGLNPVDDSYRWLSGEDDPAFGGAIRDLWRPVCYGDPGKVSDSQYTCSSLDAGGVHTNSGVPNHAFALMVDGGTYNSQVITGLGLTKAAHVFWESLLMLVPASSFSDQADALEASCAGLIDINLPGLSTASVSGGSSGEIISIEDCDQVTAIIEAVELRGSPPHCNFDTLLENNPPERCLDQGDLESFSLSDWESGIGTWTAATHGVVNPLTFDTDDWAVVGDLPGDREGSAAFVADLNSGDCAEDDETGALTLDSAAILIPGETEAARLSINHWMSSERDWDGGNFKLSVNGGSFELIPESAFEVSPYNDTLFASDAGNTNPLAGELAFTGADGGTLNGSWGQSQILLSGLAGGGDEVRLRFDFGVDACSGAIGWYVDEVELYSCTEEFSPLCGNGVLDHIEQCDDGNNDDADGCSAICEIEEGWLCDEPIAPAVILDHSFEAGPKGGVWTESSTAFGTPICDSSCGTGSGTGPSDGTYWAWFGGIELPDDSYEEATLSQEITIPSTVTTLTFDFELPVCDSDSDYLELRVDGNIEFTVNGADAACNAVGYVSKSVDITAYADDASHTIEFYSESFTTNGANTNFFVDNLVIPGTPSVCSMPGGPVFSSDPMAGTTLDFGLQLVATESAPMNISVENPGIESLVLGCTITGDGADHFNLVSCPASVAVAGSAQIELSCEPERLGPASATLEITSNDESSPVVGFPLACIGAPPPRQVITPDPVIQVVPATDPVTIEVWYSTSDGNEELDGLGLRIHWNSSELIFNGLTSVWAPDFVSSDVACRADVSNFDNDLSTNCFVTIEWSSAGGNFPGAGNSPTLLFNADFTGDLAPAASTSVNFSASSLSGSYTLRANSSIVEEATIGPQVLFDHGFETLD